MKSATDYADELMMLSICRISKNVAGEFIKAIIEDTKEECVKAISCINVTYQGVWIGYKTAVDVICKVGKE